MQVRVGAAVMAGKLASWTSRRLGRGGGTALPGLVAARVDPNVAAHLGRQLRGGRVLVTGTNGKTTSARLLASILREARVPFLHNREGSNLMRGIASELVGAASWRGVVAVAKSPGAIGLFETDEATLPAATRALAPRAIVVTNLFRDQLDRYGEVDTVAALWREGLAVAPRDATLVLNADDPSVAELADGWPGPVHFFGIDDASLAAGETGAFDARWCRACGGSFEYDVQFFAHIGHWRCGGCGRKRPTPATTATAITLSLDASRFAVEGLGTVELPLPGAYNIANALAAIAAARVLGVPPADIARGVAAAEAAFGRQETVELEGRHLRLLLTKNPAGANQVIRYLALAAGEEAIPIAVLLSDRFADGQDVSWTWDVDFELLADRVARCWAGGTRAEDMALRLKYAGWPEARVAREPGALVDDILGGTGAGETVFVVATYTSMLDLRAELVRRGAASAFWEREAGAAPASSARER